MHLSSALHYLQLGRQGSDHHPGALGAQCDLLGLSWSAYDLVSNNLITCSWASRDSAIMLARLEPALTACATLWCFPEAFSGMRTPCSPGAVSEVNLIPDFLHSRPGIRSKAQAAKG